MKNYLLLKYLATSLREYFLIFFTATILLFTFFTKSFSEENIFTINNVTVKGKIDLNFSREKYINKAFSNSFEKETGCKLIKEPHLLNHNETKYLLIHGDILCTDDVDYQKLKKVLRNPIIQFIFLHLPKNLRLKLTGQLRKKSIEAQSYKSEKIMDVNQSAVDTLMAKHPNMDLIHGHTHRQNTHKMERYTRYVLGDWKNNHGNAIKLGENLEWLEIN